MGSLESDTTEPLHFHFSLSCIGEGNGNPLQCSCLENPRDGKPGGLLSMGSHRVWHHWSNLAAAVAAATGIPSSLLALFVVMLPKAHLTSHSRMSGSRWVITPLWSLGDHWVMKIFFVQFFCVFLPPLLNIFCFCYAHTISVLYCAFILPLFCPLLFSSIVSFI